MDRPVILFGAGKLGQTAFLTLEEKYNIDYFCDNDLQKQGQFMLGIEIINPEKIKELINPVVIVCSLYYREISWQLLEMNVDTVMVFSTNVQLDSEPRILREKEFSLEELKVNSINNTISLIQKNYSGSNTYALSKLIPEKYRTRFFINKMFSTKTNWMDDNICWSRVVITSFAEIFNKINGQIHLELWHGFPFKKMYLMDDTSIFKKNKIWNEIDFYASYSTFYNTLFNACIGTEGVKYRITGMPRNDFLFSADGLKNLLSLSGGIFSGRKIILYAPTFRFNQFENRNEGGKTWTNVFGFESFDWKRFLTFLDSNNCTLILKLHPAEEEYIINQWPEVSQNLFLLKDEHLEAAGIDLYEILNAVDILLTDYSSIYFDFLLLDRPEIFIPADLEQYTQKRGFLLEPYDFWTPGPKADTQDSLEAAIVNSLSRKSYFAIERQTIRDLVHCFKDGKSSERVWDLIAQMIEEKNKGATYE